MTKLSDIMLLRKFTNLQTLDFGIIMYPQNKIPKWMSILSKFGNFDPNKRLYIDLEPLEKLYSLEEIHLRGPIKNLEPLKNLKELKSLLIADCKNITDEQIEDIQKALPDLEAERSNGTVDFIY